MKTLKTILLANAQMTDKIMKIVFVLSTIILIMTYQFWSFIKEHYHVKIYYIGVAISLFGYVLTITMLAIKNNYSKKFVILSEYVLILAMNNLLDELFFDPTKFQLNEYISVGIITLITFKNLLKQ